MGSATQPFKLTVEEALSVTGSSLQGLSSAEAGLRLAKYGPNALVEKSRRSRLAILLEQFTDVFVIILIVAALVSAFIGDITDSLTIFAIVVLNALLGYSQESKAEQAMAALRKLAVPRVRVIRDGNVAEVPATELVPGDIVLLEAGQMVPADCRLIETANLKIQESALTGEAEAVDKSANFVAEDDLPLGDRSNMAFMGTVVTYGRAQALVVATGMQTELGRIASLLQEVSTEPTPLQRRLASLAEKLLKAILIIATLIAALGIFRGESVATMLMLGVSIAVAAVPEALPAVLTITLALGAQRMLKRNALIRKLQAVETLGSVTVICSDKTGTLTENRQTAVVIDLPDREISLDGVASVDASLELLLTAIALCNDASTDTKGDPVGDPTETALLVAAERLGLRKRVLESSLPRIAEKPFDSERKRMSTLHAAQDHYISFTKGAVDSMLDVCSGVAVGTEVFPIDDVQRSKILRILEQRSASGLRILGVGYRKHLRPDTTELETDLTFLGMIGIIDPPRPEAKTAIAKCRTAGIRTLMITGDHPLTAAAIAKQLGLPSDKVVTGLRLQATDDAELEKLVLDVSIYARVSPEHKLRIVQALQKNGHIVAMTGDGVNDAPALKRANIGVAMGITGTDVSKEASDVVLLDDNFATIVAAVEEGRVIYDNIRKYIKQTLTGNSAAIWLMVFAPVLGVPLPLTPIQILWVNLVADGLPSVTLGLEPAERDIMTRPPLDPNESIFKPMAGRIIAMSLLLGMLLVVEAFYLYSEGFANWQTILLTTLIVSRMSLILSAKSWNESLFTRFLTNVPLLGAVALTLLLQLAIVYLPIFNRLFGTLPLAVTELILACVLGLLPLAAAEIFKLLAKRNIFS
ncbi:MAG: cation-translocating P-type ATPase [Acidobacteriota bacterium]|nr:cation-translocating P-type ATPase [Blastocatellia bacterium]MDW8411906.1 cation-translocating P-type ATPase [Acidobacteriota bacterium]